MPVFTYKAIDVDASAVAGAVAADTPREARDQLRARGLTIQQVADSDEATSAGLRERLGRWRAAFGRRHHAKVVALVRELSTLLAVGIPLLEALDTAARQYRGGFATVVLRLRDRVAAGATLADAMRQQPAVFDELTVNVVEVGEHAGNLDEVLDQLATFAERSIQLRGRVGAALLYPCIVLTVGLCVAVFLMSFVVPKLLDSLTEAGRPLPWATTVVKGISDALVQHSLWLLVGFVGAAALLVSALRSERGRLLWHRVQLRVPVLGELVRKQAIVRIAMVVSTLMRSGIAFERAVSIAGRVTRNRVLRDALWRCEQAVRAGRDIGPALASTGAFGPTVEQVFAVGQQSGRLEEMLDRLAGNYDRQVTAASHRLAAVIEPVLILLLAVIVGFIAFATVLPILEAGKVV